MNQSIHYHQYHQETIPAPWPAWLQAWLLFCLMGTVIGSTLIVRAYFGELTGLLNAILAPVGALAFAALLWRMHLDGRFDPSAWQRKD